MEGVAQEVEQIWVAERLAEIDAQRLQPFEEVRALAKLASEICPSKSKIFEESLDIALAIQSESVRSDALMATASQLSEAIPSLLKQALDAAKTIQNESVRSAVLKVVFPHISEATPDLLQQALDTALAIQDERDRSEALSAIAPQLSKGTPEPLQQTINAAQSIQDEVGRIKLLIAIAPQLSEANPELLNRALDVAKTIEYNKHLPLCSEFLIAISPHLSEATPELLKRALDAAETIAHRYRSATLSAIASQLRTADCGAVLQQALDAAKTLGNEGERREALSAIAPQLSEATPELLKQALDAAKTLGNEGERREALSAIAPQLSEATPELLKQALDAALAIQDKSFRREALSAIAPQLSEATPELLKQALDVVLVLGNERERREALSTIAPDRSEARLQQVLNVVSSLQDEYYCSEALSAVSPYLSEAAPELLKQARNTAQAIQDKSFRSKGLSAIAPQLSVDDCGAMGQQALDAALVIQDESSRNRALSTVALQLSKGAPELLQQALNAAQAIQNESSLHQAFIAIAPQLSKATPELLKQALDAALSIQYDYYRSEALIAIAPQLSKATPELLKQALDAALAIQDAHHHKEALSAVAPRLSESDRSAVLQQLLDDVQAFQDSPSCIEFVLGAISLHLNETTPELLKQALDAALSIPNKRFFSSALTSVLKITSRLSETDFSTVLKQALDAAQAILNEYDRSEALITIIRQLDETTPELLKQAYAAAQTIQQELQRILVLNSIALQLSNASDRCIVLTRALDTARTIHKERDRISALGVIAPNLNEAERHAIFQESFDLVQSGRKQDRFMSLRAIASQLSGATPAMLKQVLDAAKDIVYSGVALRAIASSLRKAAPEMIEQVHAAALGIQSDKYSRSIALSAISPYLHETKRCVALEQAFEAALSMDSTDGRELHFCEAMRGVITHLSVATPELFQEVFETASALKFESARNKLLSAISIYLSKTERSAILKQAFDAAPTIQDEAARSLALMAPIQQLSEETPELLKQALDTLLKNIQNKGYLSGHLKKLGSKLSLGGEKFVAQYASDQLSSVLNLVNFRETDAQKVQLLSTTVPHLSLGLLPQALELVKHHTIRDKSLRVEALSNLAPYLLPEQFTEALELCQPSQDLPDNNKAAVNRFIQEIYIAEAIANLLPYLKTLEQYETARTIIQNFIPSPVFRSKTLKVFATELATARIAGMVIDKPSQTVNLSKEQSRPSPIQVFSGLVESIWEILQALPGDIHMSNRASILSRLIPAMSISQVDNVEATLSSIFLYQDEGSNRKGYQDTGYIAQLLTIIAKRRLSKHPIHNATDQQAQKDEALSPEQKILNSLNSVEHDLYSPVLIYRQVPERLDQAIPLAKQIASPFQQAEAWVEIASHSAKSEHHYTALQSISQLPNTYLQSQYIQRLIPHLHTSQQLEAARVANSISQPYHAGQAFIALACQFPQFRSAAETSAISLEDLIQRIEQLSLLAVEVPSLLPKIIRILEKHHPPTDPQATSNDKETDPETQQWSAVIERRQLLVALAPHLPMRINREVSREGTTDISGQLWRRALYLLARGYRDALTQGSLRNETAQDEDKLNLKDEVNALANLLLMRDLEPPMTVGILGGWGGGKSYIMHLMQAHMTQVRSRAVTATEAWDDDPNHEKLSPYVGHIYQIKFDAWTFAKSDLWASLMQTIFVELNRQITLELQLRAFFEKENINPDSENSTYAGIWQVLYKASEEDRKYFLQQVLKLEDLEEFNQAETVQGIHKTAENLIWGKAVETKGDSLEQLKNKQNELEEKEKELTKKRKLLVDRKQTIEADYQTSQAELAQKFQKVHKSALKEAIQESLGVSGLILKRRLGSKFEDLQKEIIKELPDDANIDDLETFGLHLKVAITKVIEGYEADDEKRSPFHFAWHTMKEWVQTNLTFLIVFVLFAIASIIIPVLVAQVQSTAIITQIVALITPLLPTIAMAQKLWRSGQKWHDQAKQALKDYEQQIEIESKRYMEKKTQAWLQNSPVKISQEAIAKLEAEIKELEDAKQQDLQEIQKIENELPENLPASLADYVMSRIQAGTYDKQLGLMHRIKQDLTDLSRRLLPPSTKGVTSEEFKQKMEALRTVFPRGPARVVVYIDDLDRCPPSCVIQVLEAVQLLVKTPLFIAVLAIDERYITRALEKQYQGILSRRGCPSGTDYLEKIIQLPYRVRPIMATALESYLRSQIAIQDNATGGAKFSEFTRQEFDMLLACCQQVDLSPRTLKRLTNVYKLFKIVCRTRGTKPNLQVQKAILALLALSGRYPNLIRGIFDSIETCFEEQRLPQHAEEDSKILHQGRPLRDFFEHYQLAESEHYLQRHFEKLRHDALETQILPAFLTLNEMTHEIFNLIRSFSFVGEVGEGPE